MTHLPRRHRSVALAALATAGLLALSACGTSQPSESDTDDEGGSAGEEIVLEGADGTEITLDGPAEKVVALEWVLVEEVLSLGVEPVGVADVPGYNTWDSAETLAESTVDVGTRGEADVTAIFETEPDLVLAPAGTPGLDQLAEYDIPVLYVGIADAEDPIGTMKDGFELVATALGKEDEADTVLEEFDAAAEDAAAQIADAGVDGAGFVYADAYVQGSTLSIRPFGQGSYVGELGEEIGLTNLWEGEVDEAYGLGQTDVEGIAAVDDASFLYTGTESDQWLNALEDNPVWTNSSFVSEDRVRAFEPGVWTFGGPRSGEQIMAAFVEAMTS